MTDESRRAFMRSAALAAPLAAGAVAQALGEPGDAPDAGGASSALRLVEPGANLARAVVYGGLVHVSGVLPVKPGTRTMADDFAAQARQAMDNLRASIEAAGTRMDRVLKCTCFLTDADDFEAFNRAYTAAFGSHRPARSTVIVKALVLAGAKIEVDCVAAAG